MKKIINEYEYNEDIISEAMKTWWYSKTKSTYLGIVVLSILMLFFLFLNKNILYLLILFFFLICAIFLEWKKNKIIKGEIARAKVLFKDKKLMIKIVINNDNVHMISSQSERHIKFSDILSLSESKNLIVLSCKGDMTITLTKNGFIEGNSKECIDFFYRNLMKNTIK